MSYSTREKFYKNMQGFMVEADGYKQVSILVGQILLSNCY
jgi:hypothetical protein